MLAPLRARSPAPDLVTAKVAAARKHLENRRLARTGAKLGLTVAPESSPAVTVGEIIRNDQQDGYPDRQRAARKPETQKAEEGYCHILLAFWDKIPVDEVTLKTCDQYFDWRRRKLTRGSGERTGDLELNTLNNCQGLLQPQRERSAGLADLV